MQESTGEEMVTIKATFTVDPEKFAWGLYNAHVRDFSLRKLPIDENGQPAVRNIGCGVGDYPADLIGCVDDLGKPLSIVVKRAEGERGAAYWFKTDKGTYEIDHDCDPAFDSLGFVRVKLPVCANAWAYYFDPQVAAAFCEAGIGSVRSKDVPEGELARGESVDLPTPDVAWSILAETLFPAAEKGYSWEQAGLVTAATWIDKNGWLVFDPAKGSPWTNAEIRQLERRINLLAACTTIGDEREPGEKCVFLSLLAGLFNQGRVAHYNRLQGWIQKQVAPKSEAACRGLEKECWGRIRTALWSTDVLAKYVHKPGDGSDSSAWRDYLAALDEVLAPIFRDYGERLKAANSPDNPYARLDGSRPSVELEVAAAVEKWMRGEDSELGRPMTFIPNVCNKGEDENPHYGKDDDLSQIWLLELYASEVADVRLSSAKSSIDHGHCKREILNANAPYGRKLAAAALELAMKELEARLELDPEARYSMEENDGIYPILEDDVFHPFVDQWCNGEFPWKKYLAM